MTRRLNVPLTQDLAAKAGVDVVGALVDEPLGRPVARVLLAHGAGLPMDAPFMARVAEGLAARGALVFRFDQPYMERMRREGRRFPPNRMPVLLAVQRAALAHARRVFGPRAAWTLAGKSMGARSSTLLLAREPDVLDAEPEEARANGAILLGYPLHPPKKPEQLRTAHFPRIERPLLFVQGTRDPLCDLELLERARTGLASAHELMVVEGGDHDLDVPKRTGRTHDDVLAEVLDRSIKFARSLR